MKLDDFSRLSDGAGLDSPSQKRERLRLKLEDRGANWSDMYQELEMSHRYVDAYTHESMEGGHVPLHSHSFYELLYCRNSCGIEYLLGPDRYLLQRGDLVFAPPGVNHRPLLTNQLVEPCRRDVIWISRDYMAQFTRVFIFPASIDWEKPFLLRTAGTSWEPLGDQVQAGVQEALRRAPGWEACLAGHTMILLTLLARALAGQEAAPLAQAERPELLERVLAYIEAHLGEPISLADTAKHFWVSESKISQTFRHKLGISFYRCVTQRRLIAAKSLIIRGTPLNEVNERVGFVDYSTFFRAFKREYGIAPRQFRELQASHERGTTPTDCVWRSERKTPGEEFGLDQVVMNRISAIILAGGRSSRMGRDKAELPFQGMTLLEWQVKKLQGLGIRDVMLSGSRQGMEGARVVPDEFPGLGPLSGLHACMRAAAHPDCLVLSVDAPLVPSQALAELVRVHRESGNAVTLLRHSGKWEPLIGVYQSRLFQCAESVLQGPNTAVQRLLDETGFQLVDWPGDEELFINCNTPEDYKQLCRRAEQGHI